MTIVLIYIDADIQILPDVIDLPGIAIGLASARSALGALIPRLMLGRLDRRLARSARCSARRFSWHHRRPTG